MDEQRSVLTWLLQQVPGTRVEDLMGPLNDRLIALGVAVQRSAISVQTRHPELFTRAVVWERGEGVDTVHRQHELKQTALYVGSPGAEIHAGAPELHISLEGPRDAIAYQTLRDLADEGATDYAIFALLLPHDRRTFVSWTTNRPGGFSDAEMALFRELLPALSLHVSLDAELQAVGGLLQVYLGANAGQRVLAGAFRRGTGELIRAAIWFCDLRGFTELSDRLPVRDVVALLDRYFEAVAVPVTAGGGEILKFIGDAVLAIFPVDGDPAEPCRRALKAAEEALAGLERLNATTGQPALRIGVALHVGEIMYGNIGSPTRLDFTAIGASVNEVCRVEALCKPLHVPLLVTAPFAQALQSPELISMGSHALKGVSAPPEVFSLKRFRPEESP